MLHSDPRFEHRGTRRASRWSVREAVNAVDSPNGEGAVTTTSTVDELARRWKCDPAMVNTIVFGAEGFLERGYVESVDGNGRVRVTQLGRHVSHVLNGARR